MADRSSAASVSAHDRGANPVRRLVEMVARDDVSRGVILGAGASFATHAAGMFVSAVSSLVMARLAGADAYGVFAFLLSWATILALISNLGMETIVVRFVPKYQYESSWALVKGLSRWAQLSGLACGVVIGLVFGAVVQVTSSGNIAMTTSAWVAAALIPLTAVLLTTQGMLRALRRMVASILPAAVLRPGLGLLLVVAVYLANASWLNAPVLMLVTVVSTLVALSAALRVLSRRMPEETRPVKAETEARAWFPLSGPLVLMGLMRMVFLQADVVLVGLLVGTTEAGIYAIASRLTQLVLIGNLSSNAIAGPLIARAWARQDKNEAQQVAAVSSRVSTLVALVAGAALLVLGRKVLGWAGEEFVAGTTVVQLLILGNLVNAVTGPVGQIMNLTGHERVNAKISGLMLLVFLAASVPVISTWGIVGAAGLRAAVVALKNLWTWFVVRAELRISSVPFTKAREGSSVAKDVVRP